MSPRRAPISAATFVAVLVLAVLVGTLIGFGFQWIRGDGNGTSGATSTTAPALDPDLPDEPVALWMFGSSTLRGDPALATVVGVPVEVFGAVVGARGAVYSWSSTTGEFRVLETAENRVTVTAEVDLGGDVDVDTAPLVVAVGDAAWVVTGPDTVARVDAQSGDVTASVTLPSSFVGAADGTSVTATRIVSSGAGLFAVFDVETEDGSIAVGLASLDPMSGEILAVSALTERSTQGVDLAAVGDDALWIVSDEELIRVSAADLTETGRLSLADSDLGGPIDALLALGDNAWILDRDGPDLVQVGPSLTVEESARLTDETDDLDDAPATAVVGDESIYTLLQRSDGSSIVARTNIEILAVERRIGLPTEAFVAALAFSEAPSRAH